MSLIFLHFHLHVKYFYNCCRGLFLHWQITHGKQRRRRRAHKTFALDKIRLWPNISKLPPTWASFQLWSSSFELSALRFKLWASSDWVSPLSLEESRTYGLLGVFLSFWMTSDALSESYLTEGNVTCLLWAAKYLKIQNIFLWL